MTKKNPCLTWWNVAKQTPVFEWLPILCCNLWNAGVDIVEF